MLLYFPIIIQIFSITATLSNENVLYENRCKLKNCLVIAKYNIDPGDKIVLTRIVQIDYDYSKFSLEKCENNLEAREIRCIVQSQDPTSEIVQMLNHEMKIRRNKRENEESSSIYLNNECRGKKGIICKTLISYDKSINITSINSTQESEIKLPNSTNIYCQIQKSKTICLCFHNDDSCSNLDRIFEEIYMLDRQENQDFDGFAENSSDISILPKLLDQLDNFRKSFPKIKTKKGYGCRKQNENGVEEYCAFEMSFSRKCDSYKLGAIKAFKDKGINEKSLIYKDTRGVIGLKAYFGSTKPENMKDPSIILICQLDACRDVPSDVLVYRIIDGLREQIDSNELFVQYNPKLEETKKFCFCAMKAFQTGLFSSDMKSHDEKFIKSYLLLEKLHGYMDLSITSILTLIFIGMIIAIIVLGCISKTKQVAPLSIEHMEKGRSRIATCRSQISNIQNASKNSAISRDKRELGISNNV